MIGEPVPSLVKSTIENLTFENVVLNGKRVSDMNDISLDQISKEIKNIKFLYDE